MSIRCSQSSLTTDTHVPVRSIGAAALGGSPVTGAAPRPRCAPTATPPVTARIQTTVMASFFISSPSLDEIAIRGLDEHRRRPWTARRAEQAVVFERRPRRLHLFERHAFLDQVLNAIAHDRQHVAVLDEIRLVADTSLSRNHHRPPLLPVVRNRDVDDAIDGGKQAAERAALSGID